MKKLIALTIMLGCMVTLSVSAAVTPVAPNPVVKPATPPASVPATPHITPMAIVLKNLQSAGYVAIQKIRLAEGVYKAEAINVQGEKIDVRIDPETGNIVEPTSTQLMITMLTVVDKVEAAGYHSIYKIESNGDNYDVKALDKNGKDAHLTVDVVTGKVVKKWF